MLKGKTVLVTSGGTQEYIDDVRVLTNISSGRLGANIAEAVFDAGANVIYLYGKNSVMPPLMAPLHDGHNMSYRPVRTAQDAYNEMEKIVPTVDAVIHCMAVSDFTFRRDKAIKCKSSDPQAFIDFMRDTITTNPKIISKVKEWNPKVFLVGFKFEVGITREDLIDLAIHSIESNGCDMVVANDKKEMEAEGEHVAHFVYSEKVADMLGFHVTSQHANYETVRGKMGIALNVRKVLERV